MAKYSAIPAFERAGMSRVEAAEYIGVSPTLFDQMVADGRMTRPKMINSRKVWLRAEIEKALAALPDDGDLKVADADGRWLDCA